MAEDARSASGTELRTAYPRYNRAVLGFPNYWYPVMFSRDLGARPVPLTILGEKLVLVRHRGSAYALHNRCPHRGIPRSDGRCEAEGGSKVNVRTHPVQERAGLIWVFIGKGQPPPLEVDMPPGLCQPGVLVEGVIQVRKGNWRYAAENGIDEGHAKYLHRHALWTMFREMPAWSQGVKMVPSDDGPWLMRRADGVRYADDYPRVGRWPPVPKPWQSRARGALVVGIRLPGWLVIEQRGWTGYEVYVPWDETHYLCVLLAAVPVQTRRQAAAFRLKYRCWLRWVYHGQFNAQDQWVIDRMQIPPERLYRPDVSITAWRKLCEEQARAADWTPTPTGPDAEGSRSAADFALADP